MKFVKLLKRCAIVAIATCAVGLGGAANAMPIQLGIAIDASGSVSDADYAIQVNGLAAALAAIPTDSTVEITVVQFGANVRNVAGPVVVDSATTLATLVARIDAMNRNNVDTSATNGAGAINRLTNRMIASSSFGGDAIINISTDGELNRGNALNRAKRAKRLGIDALTAEAIGSGANTNQLLSLVFNPSTNPNTGNGALLAPNAAPGNPLTSPAWVVPVTNFAAFGPVLNSKIQAIVGPPVAVPEPGAVALVGIGVLALVLVQMLSRRRKGREMNTLAMA